MNLLSRTAAALLVIWALAGTGIWLLKKATPTAESVTAAMEKTALSDKSAAQRADAINAIAEQLNPLDYEQRQLLRKGKAPAKFFASLTKNEQFDFLDRTLPAGFQQMMEAFNRMEPARRKKMVQRALTGMEQDDGRRPPEFDDRMAQRMVDQGLRSFYNDASAETKMDLAPLIEQMQARMQHLER